jgi:hypothetical protein
MGYRVMRFGFGFGLRSKYETCFRDSRGNDMLCCHYQLGLRLGLGFRDRTKVKVHVRVTS